MNEQLYHIWAQRYDGSVNGRWASSSPSPDKVRLQAIAARLNEIKNRNTYEVREFHK